MPWTRSDPAYKGEHRGPESHSEPWAGTGQIPSPGEV